VSRRATDAARFGWAAGLMAAMFGVAAFSQARVQLFQREQTLDLAQDSNRYTFSRRDSARRGAVFSADGKPLAQDEESYELVVEFQKVPLTDAFFVDVSAATGIPASEFLSLAASGAKSRTWRTPLSAARYEQVQTLKGRWRADGLSARRIRRRDYPLGASAANLIGVVREGKAAFGLEASQNERLAGTDGRTVGLVDRTGAFLPMRLKDTTVSRTDGESMVLTIHSQLQVAATDAVRRAVETHKADNGVAVVLDPKTGDLLALASWPSFEPYSPDGTEAHLSEGAGYNPAFMAVFEPGSTFKILTLAKAIDEGKATMGQTIDCAGILQLNQSWRIRCSMHAGRRAHGVIDGETAIAKSCNVAAATWALRLGRDEFVEFMEDLGLLSRTGLGLPKETVGQFNRNEYAKPLQLMNLGFGQSMSTSPVALAGAFGLLANEGRLMPPRLIKRVGEQELPLPEPKPVITPETAERVLRCMESVIHSDGGTGKTLKIPGYRLAGKTGTAQKIGGGSGGGYVANFVGYVPAQDPEAVVLVMINHPKSGSYYGGSVAGPVFVDIAKAIIRVKNVRPTERVGGAAAPVSGPPPGGQGAA
jgi:cell division protein FtsI (penicillin-binding protein 3)